jgi:hypothetical protein
MEPTPNKSQSPNREQDVDLGLLLYKAGQATKRSFAALGRGFSLLGTGLLFALFFLKRNLLWLALGTGLGLAYGFYLKERDGLTYSSNMTVRTNFNSSPSLYNTVDYINALIGQGRTTDLSRMFSVDAAHARTIRHVEARPLRSETVIARMYTDQFLIHPRNDRFRLDTFWAKTITYKDYKSNLSRDDFPYHIVTVTSTSSDIFPKIQKGIVDFISGNEVLKRNRESAQQISAQEESLINSSLGGLDTLRSTYNKKLLLPAQAPSQPTVNLYEEPFRMETPELELYDKVLELRDELKSARASSLMSQEIVQVYSPFSPVGREVSLFRQNIFQNAITGLLLMLIILVGISFYKFLTKLEQAQKKRRQPVESTFSE